MSVDTAFVKQFEREVHSAYQRMGSKLRNTVRTSSNVDKNIWRIRARDEFRPHSNRGSITGLLRR